MGIGLMADIPDEFIPGSVVYVMKGDGKLNDAETGTEMPPCSGYGIDGFSSQFRGNSFHAAFRKLAKQIRGRRFVQIRGLHDLSSGVSSRALS
jgi:hypothetical protein